MRLLFGQENAQLVWMLVFLLMPWALAGMTNGNATTPPQERLPFYVLGLIVAGILQFQLGRGWRARRLVARGVLTEGKRISIDDLVESTGQGTEKRVVGKCFAFGYEVRGTAYVLEVETENPWGLMFHPQPILYDPRRPRRAISLNHLPGKLTITDDGQLQATDGKPFHLLLIPIATLGTIAAFVAYWIVR